MKDMMAELSSRFAKKGTSRDPPSSIASFSVHDAPRLNHDQHLEEWNDGNSATSGDYASLHDEGAEASITVAPLGVAISSQDSAEDNGAPSAGFFSHGSSDSRVRPKASCAEVSAEGKCTPVASMKDMMVGLAAKTKAKEAGSTYQLEVAEDKLDEDIVGERTATITGAAVEGIEAPRPVAQSLSSAKCQSRDNLGHYRIPRKRGESGGMKNLMAELVDKAKARKERSVAKVMVTPPPRESGGTKGLMVELADKAKAREERSVGKFIVMPPSLPVLRKHAEGVRTQEDAGQSAVVADGGMKSLMVVELAAKTDMMREDKSSISPQPPPAVQKHAEGVRTQNDTAAGLAVGGGGGGMKGLMAELATKVKARAERFGAAANK